MAKRIVRIVLEALSLLVILGTIVFLLIYWKHVPEQVPTHFGVRGQIDAWGERQSLWLLPVVNTFVYVLLTVCNAIALAAKGGELPPSAALWLSAFKLPFVVLLSAIALCQALVRPLPVWLTPVALIAPLVPIAGLAITALRYQARQKR
jgi:hypothetical protein